MTLWAIAVGLLGTVLRMRRSRPKPEPGRMRRPGRLMAPQGPPTPASPPSRPVSFEGVRRACVLAAALLIALAFALQLSSVAVKANGHVVSCGTVFSPDLSDSDLWTIVDVAARLDGPSSAVVPQYHSLCWAALMDRAHTAALVNGVGVVFCVAGVLMLVMLVVRWWKRRRRARSRRKRPPRALVQQGPAAVDAGRRGPGRTDLEPAHEVSPGR